jgi:tetratricopeptide (TPR) repeat protein
MVGKITSIDEKSKFVRMERSTTDEVSNFLFALGNKFVDVGNAEAAFDCFKYSVDLNDKNQPSVYNLGCLYSLSGNFEGAYKMFKEASRMSPTDLLSKISLAEVTRKLGKMGEAEELMRLLLKLDPDNLAILSGMAILCYDLGRLAEAAEWNDRAIEKSPADTRVLLNQALINMTFGTWAPWWAQYEFCLSYQKNERMHGLSMSDAWHGQEIEGKTLLVVSDQGSGDAIQFSRYLKEAKALGKFEKLIYLVQPDLLDLLARVDGVDEVVGFAQKMHLDYDAFSSLLGVMRVLQVDPANCYRPPHIVTNPKLDAVWESRIGEVWDGCSKKVGIVWGGDAKHGNDRNRSIPLSLFVKLMRGTATQTPATGVQYFSLQVGEPARQLFALAEEVEIGKEVVDLGIDFRSFDDTASALRQMDLVISCDTSVPHLAGCLGIPTWILVANPGEWRWGTDGGSTPWYQSVRLFRQKEPKNWDSTMEAVLHNLKEWVRCQN